MLMYQKRMFDRYHCIKRFFHSKTLEKLLQKVLFIVHIMARKSTLPVNVLKMRFHGKRLRLRFIQELRSNNKHILSIEDV